MLTYTEKQTDMPTCNLCTDVRIASSLPVTHTQIVDALLWAEYMLLQKKRLHRERLFCFGVEVNFDGT